MGKSICIPLQYYTHQKLGESEEKVNGYEKERKEFLKMIDGLTDSKNVLNNEISVHKEAESERRKNEESNCDKYTHIH